MKNCPEMDRRSFLALAGGGAAGLALPAGVSALAEPADATPATFRIQTARYRLREAVTDLMSLPGRRVRVRGWVEWWNGLMIEISHPKAIEVLAPSPGAG